MNATNDAPQSSTTMPVGRRMPNAYTWLGGAVLILIGGIFLLRNAGVIDAMEHWWALFLLIPIVVTAGTAWAQFRAGGWRLTPAVSGSLAGSLILAVVAAIFLLGLHWGTIWPVFLIIAGVTSLLQWAGWRGGDGRVRGDMGRRM